MNTHLNLVTEHERKRAETLRSFSRDPVSENIEPPKHDLRRLVLPICLFTLISGATVGVVLHSTDVALRIQTLVAALLKPGKTTAEAVSAPGVVEMPQDGRDAENAVFRNPATSASEITGSGFVVAPRMTTVFSKYEGRITHVAVEAGDVVESGQVLVTLDDASARFALEQAKAGKAAAELQLAARTIDIAQSRVALDRTEILAARDAAPMKTLEEARTDMELASNAVAQARQSAGRADLSIRIAEERLAELTVRAPFAGTVTRLDAHVGDTVLARLDSVRENQSLLTITDTTSLMIDADVSETKIAALRPGLRGEAVLDGFPDLHFGVDVLRLAPVASAEKGTIAVRLSLDRPPEGIRPNMAARIRIPLNDAGDTPQ